MAITPQTGDIIQWGGRSNAIPTGWLLCDGAAVSRTTYAALFTAIGTTFGAGDGSTTFNVPNSITRFVKGVNGTPGTTGGNFNHTHTGPTHGHTVTQGGDHAEHAGGGGHTHDAHGTADRGTLAATTSTLSGPTTHSNPGTHTHGTTQHAHSGAAGVSGTPADTGTNNPPYSAAHRLIHI